MKLSNKLLMKTNYKNPLYSVYQGMKKRCYTPSTSGYKNYGGKGIGVCEEWKNSFNAFCKWAINNGYYYDTDEPRAKKLSIDRIDSNKDYCPENCRLITLSENTKRAIIGRVVSEETRKKISVAHKGKLLTEDHKKKLSICSKGKGKNNLNAKKGFYKMYDKNYNLIKIFNRPKDIEVFFEPKRVALGTINSAAHKNGYRKTAYGYIWEYTNES